MNRREALVCGAATLVSSCDVLPTVFPSYRFRLTINVDTPAGRRSGSSVFEVQTSKNGTNFPASPNQLSFVVRGEAVVVDLPSGALFGILNPDYLGGLMIFLNEWKSKLSQGAIYYALKKRDVEHIRRNRSLMVLPRHYSDTVSAYPRMVRFSQERRPETVRWVDPDRLSDEFGTGVQLHNVTAQITSQSISRDMASRLTWLPEYEKNQWNLHGRHEILVQDNLATSNLDAGSFSTELK